MKKQKFRFTYLTPLGKKRNNITIEGESREEAENDFKKDFKELTLIN